jgi:hypothetical protein
MQQQSLNSELILSKEQLYDMFQQILGIKKFEHQLLFNALQVNGVRTNISFCYILSCEHRNMSHVEDCCLLGCNAV